MDPMHLCSVFSNLMDNAIRGVEDLKEKEAQIHLTARMSGDYLFIKTTNPTSAKTTNKPSAKGHGYGTGILKSIAELYQGSFQTNYENGMFTAFVTILVLN